MSTIADRLAEILDDAAKEKISARELSKRCGLPPTQLSTVYKKLTVDPLAVELRTLDRIARGTGVRVEWLTFGIGRKEAEPAMSVQEARSRAREGLAGVAAGRTEIAGEILQALAIAGDPAAVDALAEIARGFWRLGIDLLAQIIADADAAQIRAANDRHR